MDYFFFWGFCIGIALQFRPAKVQLISITTKSFNQKWKTVR